MISEAGTHRQNPERSRGNQTWRKRVGVEPTNDRIACHPPVLKLSRFAGVSEAGARRRNPEQSRGNPSLAEANGSRTHRRYREITTAGFEDRDDHRTACASASTEQATDCYIRGLFQFANGRATLKGSSPGMFGALDAALKGRSFTNASSERPRHILPINLSFSLRLLRCPQIRLHGLESWKFLRRFFVGHCRGDDHVVAGFPVHGGGDFVFRGELHGVDDA